jgi:plasmid maintenance system antidote protein VapI
MNEKTRVYRPVETAFSSEVVPDQKSVVTFQVTDIAPSTSGQWIRHFLAQDGASLREFAKRSGVGIQALSAIQNSKRVASAEHLVRITEAFGWKENDIFTRFLLQKASVERTGEGTPIIDV